MAKRILVVDDSQTERFTIGETLKAAGYELDFAEDGEQGHAKAGEILPDLIVMDVVMPGLNGFQACRKITQEDKTKHIPIVLCTTKGQETDKMWGERQGAKGYIVKPIDQEELIDKIKSILN